MANFKHVYLGIESVETGLIIRAYSFASLARKAIALNRMNQLDHERFEWLPFVGDFNLTFPTAYQTVNDLWEEYRKELLKMAHERFD